MDALAADGTAVLVGPLEGMRGALLIMRGEDPDDVAARLEPDPWTANGLLRTTWVAPWTLRIGSVTTV
jgi:uncharacterized protein YciI